MTDPALADYRTDPYCRVMTDVVNTHKPEIVLLGATTLGRDLAGAIATTLATGLTADCTELDIYADNRSLAATRPTFGGTLLCTIQTLAYRPQMATVRPRVMAMPGRDDARTGRVIEIQPDLREEDIITKVLNFIADREQNEAQLAFADIIVSAGKGLGKVENMKLVFDLAKVLGAEVGVTRPLVQAGWATNDRQVGQTGKTVRPKLYIAAGISGAIQHRVGMEKSDLILAINTDPNATIFDFAHLGLVGDALKILPALTDAFGPPPVRQPHGRLTAGRDKEPVDMVEKFDAIVIGAGPSGNAATYTLAKQGLKVLQLERGEYPGAKNVQGRHHVFA